MKAKDIREECIAALREKFGALAAAELDGFSFAAADIGVKGEDGTPEVFRITVVSQRLDIKGK